MQSPAADPYLVMHAGQSRILRHSGYRRHQQQPQRKSACAHQNLFFMIP